MEGASLDGWLQIVCLLGAVQGVFLAAVLVSRRRHPVSSRLLAAAMLVFSVDLGMAVYHASGTDARFPALIGLDFPAALLYGPLLYLYARTVTGRPPSARDLLHFVPFALLVLLLTPFYLETGAEKLALLRAPGADPWARAFGVINGLKLAHGIAYIGLVLRLLRRHRARIRDAFSSIEQLNLIWLRNLTAGVVALAALSGTLYLLGLGSASAGIGLDPAGIYDDLSLIGVTLFVYAIGYLGLRQPEIHGPPLAPAAGASPASAERPRYARSGMDDRAAEESLRRLVELMETARPYRRGDLTLQELADALSISAHNLTEVINTRTGQNFYDFVNGYRVREVQARLADPACAGWSLLAVGLEAGFNSKSSFNAVFKKHTGLTPSEYRAGLEQPSPPAGRR